MLSTKLKLSWVLVIVGRSTFSLEIYPGGDETAEVGKISVFLSIMITIIIIIIIII